MTWLLWKRKQNTIFPSAPKNVLHEEKTASGRSHKNWYSKLGGARNCLKLIITADELWVTPIFPFSALSSAFDLDHRINIKSIIDITESKLMLKKSIIIEYIDSSSNKIIIEVVPKNIHQFRRVLNK